MQAAASDVRQQPVTFAAIGLRAEVVITADPWPDWNFELL